MRLPCEGYFSLSTKGSMRWHGQEKYKQGDLIGLGNTCVFLLLVNLSVRLVHCAVNAAKCALDGAFLRLVMSVDCRRVAHSRGSLIL